ncbi:RES family NAD+ phosphorylase [Caulobacter hibisci]|uniref:RES domain-containing protein n=1 Tax=Caulobacter hibisci TaxID=2035993 RepID=A0ABS0SXN1_9CAUL|nr:RES domain-containing protein [Caulobacter hibisci]MBI1684179.1 RES domain-containing protein [Caulobacter hibisci]
MQFAGPLYRALNPVYARDPMSGRGAQLYGGRFNPKGTPALYGALTIMTAVREANQVGALQPTTLVSYDAEIESIFDARDDKALAAHGVSAPILADNGWRDEMKIDGISRTQAFSQRLVAEGFQGLLVRSFAPGSGAGDLNLVLWTWGPAAPSRLTLIDDEGRLSR